MALDQQEAAYLAGLLPADMRCDDARQRLLCVAQILQSLTDEHHALSNAEIRAILRARFGAACTPSENTIAADIHALQTGGSLDLLVHMGPRGCWCERACLTPANVRLMLNAVQSSRFLTAEQSAELQESLFGLVSRHQEDDLAGEVLVDQRVRKSYQHVFDTIDKVARPIHTKHKIEFVYTYSDYSGRAHPLAGDNGLDLRCETPIALYFSENNYYVETYTPTPWRHGIEVMLSRADRMTDVRISNEPADGGRKVYDLQRSAKKRMRGSFDMVGGPLRHLFLRVRSDHTNLLYDRFGFGLRFGQYQGTLGDPAATGLTMLAIPQSHTFYRWLTSAGSGIVIEEPPGELGLRTGPWKRAVQDISRAELLEDYQLTVAGFLGYLDRARSAYQ